MNYYGFNFHSNFIYRGSQNKGFTSEYEDLDRDLWHASKGGEGAVTHNPAFGKEDDFRPLDVVSSFQFQFLILCG